VAKSNATPGADKWLLNAGRLREDVYQLATIVIASRDHEWALGLVGLEELREEFEQHALDHALVTIAIRARVLLDQTPRTASLATARSKRRSGPRAAEQVCGTLLADIDSADTARPLRLRDACNKIIHAETRHFAEYSGDPGLTGMVRLEGKLKPPQIWRADLDVFKFVRAVLGLAAEVRAYGRS
jgi:hypothetical protein